ncbi:MAG TPA: outer membrane lipoprotein carrier protein LolA [Pseudonocardiaceae bacterium]|jgi:outer membrane lipoprotein-sorting protein|nr:outer membrane lipoprotein carrier protein LolA [Pseudonocardiaceae bacterium]
MNRRRATLGAAVIGVVAGAVGLGVLAAPAGAGQAPSLPAISPQALVQSVLTAKPVALGGTVAVTNNLGLPAIPGLPTQLTSGSSQLRVWTDGSGHSRLSLPSSGAEQTYVDDGKTLYEWDSSNKTVTEHALGAGKAGAHAGMPDNQTLTPAGAAQELVSTIQDTSTVSVNGTDTVAGRPAYDLVLTPKPQEKTLLREVTISIDSQTRVPLQVSVLANGSATPAVQVGFSSIDFGKQDPSLFTFTPPAGSTVVHGDSANKRVNDGTAQVQPKFVGTGWDTVVLATLPAEMTNGSTNGSGDPDPMRLLNEFATPISGSWGSGWAIGTSVGGAVITSDGRVAAGFVPQQVLIQALAGSK